MFRPIYGECSYAVMNWLLAGWQVGRGLEIYIGRKRSWCNLGWYPDSCLERLRKNTKIISHNSWGPFRDLNVAPPDYGLATLFTKVRIARNFSPAVATPVLTSPQKTFRCGVDRFLLTKNSGKRFLEPD